MCIPLFKNGIHKGDDGDFHISRALGTLEQIRNGIDKIKNGNIEHKIEIKKEI